MGTVYSFTPDGQLKTLYDFCSESNCADGYFPTSTLLQGTNGIIYGTTTYGGLGVCNNLNGVGCGTVFSLEMGLRPFVALVRGIARVNQQFGILGQGFTGTTAVSLNGMPAQFTVVSDTFIKATVPAGATTGYVTVTTPSGTLTSNKPFVVIP